MKLAFFNFGGFGYKFLSLLWMIMVFYSGWHLKEKTLSCQISNDLQIENDPSTENNLQIEKILTPEKQSVQPRQ